MKANTISPAFLQVLEEAVKKAVNEAFTTQKAQTARLTTAQTMATLACSRTTLWRLVKDGKLTPHKGAGRTLTYDAKEVMALRDAVAE
jgi:predicted DNA-binding transcriptional regulator AlpA